MQSRELTLVFAVRFENSQTFLYHLDQQFLGLNLAYHHISVRVTVECQLARNTLRQ